MASKFWHFPLLVTLALHVATSSATLLHFINSVADKSDRVSIDIKAGGDLKGSSVLSPDKEYQFPANETATYDATASYVSKVGKARLASFNVYYPNQNKVHADIYWRATDNGFDISYDRTNWKTKVFWD